MPVRILVTEGTRAVRLIEGISVEILLADRGYDTNDILVYAVSAGMEPVIPPKKSRKEQRSYDKYLYKLRHLAENCFLALKRWRGIATRYAKTSDASIARYTSVVSLFGLPSVLNSCRHCLAERENTASGLSSFWISCCRFKRRTLRKVPIRHSD